MLLNSSQDSARRKDFFPEFDFPGEMSENGKGGKLN